MPWNWCISFIDLLPLKAKREVLANKTNTTPAVLFANQNVYSQLICWIRARKKTT